MMMEREMEETIPVTEWSFWDWLGGGVGGTGGKA